MSGDLWACAAISTAANIGALIIADRDDSGRDARGRMGGGGRG